MSAEQDALLCEIVARHFPEARVAGSELELGFGELRMACRVDSVHAFGAMCSASLFFQLRGGRLGAWPVFASVSGYGRSVEEAITVGACNWTCAFGPVLRAGLAGDRLPDVATFEISIDGQAFRIYVDGLDRALSFGGGDASARIPAARSRFAPGSWLARAVLASDRLPVLAADRPTLLSVFVSDLPTARTVEVKVDGCDWPEMAATFASVAPEPADAGTGVLLRELAVVVPISATPPLASGPIERTLRGLAARAASAPGSPAAWSGALHHRHVLAPPLAAEQVAAVEAQIGPLPADYRDFLASVAGSGAGPGYGLLSPLAEVQLAFAAGQFDWIDGEAPRGTAAGAVCLAHAGCGVMWLLVVTGRHRGEVWVDARSADGKGHRCAASFAAWYRDWLTSAVRGASPWIQWDAGRCATAGVISKMMQALERDGVVGHAMRTELAKLDRGAISVMSAGGSYFAPKTPLNPCEGCVDLVASITARPGVFQPGRELNLGATRRTPATAKARPGWVARLRGKAHGHS